MRGRVRGSMVAGLLVGGCASASIDEPSGGISAGLASAGMTTMTTAASIGSGASESGTDASGTTDDVGTTTGMLPTTADASGGATGLDGSEGDSGPAAFCGDGVVGPDEQCDDGNDIDTDACLSSCVAASCGDALVQTGVEVCDDGVNDGAYGGCNAGCSALAPFCGDAIVQPGLELCDTAAGAPWINVGCTSSCRYDFSGLTQLYCNGSCSWAGGDSCDQADADIYCKLVTGNPASTALSYGVVVALDAPGFSCPGYGTDLGVLGDYGVVVDVWYQDSSILANHGGGSVVSGATCS